MRPSFIIVDNFLEDPHTLRNAALSQQFPKPKTPLAYPGRDSEHRQAIDGFDKRISDILGHRVEPAPMVSHCRFRLALEGDKGTESVHIDPVNWTVLLYLTLPEYCQDGTHLFRHKGTESDHAPHSASEMTAMGFSSEDDFMQNLLAKDTNNTDAWEHLTTIPMRFNRLLILEPQQYHDAGLSFGSSTEDGRLIYIATYY